MLAQILATAPITQVWPGQDADVTFGARYGWPIMVFAGFVMMLAIGLIAYNAAAWWASNHPHDQTPGRT
jgi:hypothetical protein